MQEHQTVKEMPEWKRPYEKCMESGPAALSDAELLAVILSSGSKGEQSIELAERLLFTGQNKGLTGLFHLSYEQLIQIKGIGKVKALRLQSVLEIAGRIAKEKAEKKLSFDNPASIAAYYMEDMRHLETEIVKIAMLDGKNKFLGDVILSVGTVNASMVSARELFKHAMKFQAVSIILLHNHPSGDPTPSSQDIQITNRIKEAGALLEISLIDHLIIGNNIYVSFRQSGLL